MTADRPAPDDLAEAERPPFDSLVAAERAMYAYFRYPDPDKRVALSDVARVMAEYDRRGEEIAELRRFCAGELANLEQDATARDRELAELKQELPIGEIERLRAVEQAARELVGDWWESRHGDMVNLDGTQDELFAVLAGLFGYSNGQAPGDGDTT
jgi:hypothetical protein